MRSMRAARSRFVRVRRRPSHRFCDPGAAAADAARTMPWHPRGTQSSDLSRISRGGFRHEPCCICAHGWSCSLDVAARHRHRARHIFRGVWNWYQLVRFQRRSCRNRRHGHRGDPRLRRGRGSRHQHGRRQRRHELGWRQLRRQRGRLPHRCRVSHGQRQQRHVRRGAVLGARAGDAAGRLWGRRLVRTMQLWSPTPVAARQWDVLHAKHRLSRG